MESVAMIAQQLSLADALPAMPYGDTPGYRANPASAAAASAVKPKVGGMQKRVVLALHETPHLTHRGLDRMLGTTETRTARPRCTELKLAGLVYESGQCPGELGIRETTWALTDAGEELARELLEATR